MSIGISQRWRWLWSPVVVVGAYLAVAFLSPSEYQVSAEVSLSPAAGVAGVSPAVAQDIINSVAGRAGVGSSLTLGAISEHRGNLDGARGLSDAEFARWREETARAFLVSAEADRIRVSYKGTDAALGEQLAGEIGSRLAGMATSEVRHQREIVEMQVRQLEAAARVTPPPAPAPAATTSPRLTELREQLSRLATIATPVTPAEVQTSGTRLRLTDRHWAVAFQLLLGSLLLVLLGIAFAEMTQRALTSERELSEYLSVRVVGSLPPHHS
jgi:hypothetical protein